LYIKREKDKIINEAQMRSMRRQAELDAERGSKKVAIEQVVAKPIV